MGNKSTNEIQKLSKKRSIKLLKSIGSEESLKILERMYTIRAFEEKAEQLYSLGKTHGRQIS